MAVKRLDNIGVVVEDLEAAIAFFVELGLEHEGSATVEGPWLDQICGVDGGVVDIAMVRTPDGNSRLELTKFTTLGATTKEPNAPVNTIGIRKLMYAVDDIHDTIARLQPHGGELLGEVARYGDAYLLCYLRGPGGIIVALAEELTPAG